jgi:hypothetical protein
MMTARAESADCPLRVFGRALSIFLVLASTLPANPAAAQTCDRSGCGQISCGTPAVPAPATMWGELQPADPIAPLPINRDSTAFDEFHQAYASFPWYTGLDVQNGYLVTGLAYGLQIWDLRTQPATPTALGVFPNTSGHFPVWIDSPEEKWPLQDLAMPPGDDTVAVTAGHAGVGLAMVDLTDKTKPRFLYQSYKKDGEGVYVAQIGGTEYAFLAASGGDSGGGVFAYSVTQARQTPGCFESAPTDPAACSGVYLGKIGNRVSASYIHGVDNFVAFSSGAGSSFEIWNVANPSHPTLALTGLNDVPTCGFDIRSVYGLAMWKDAAGHYYIAVRTEKYSCTQQRVINEARVYDVSCLATTCTGLGSPLYSRELGSGTSTYFVTYSTSLGTPFLYYGSDDKCGGGSQREWLFDATNPASLRDITPPTGYWGWYYRGSLTGFNNEMPRRGKFNNEYFYRSALSIFDIHKRTSGVPPSASFTFNPTVEIYPGTPINFQDTSTALPNSWNWTFQDAVGNAVPPPKP